MKKILILLFLFVLQYTTYSQDKLLTVKESELGYRMGLYPESMHNLQWRGNLSAFSYLQHDSLLQQTVSDSHPTAILTLNQINTLLKKSNFDTLTNLPPVNWSDDNTIWFDHSFNWFCIDLINKKIIHTIKLPESSENPELFYNQFEIAYTQGNNIFLNKPGQLPIQITCDKDTNIVNGTIVSRNEFGIDKGLFWSPKGNYLAFYRKDNRNVGNYPLVDITSREATLNMIKYPMAGMSSEHVSLGIYNVATGKIIYIERTDSLSEKYLTNISWAPDEQSIYIQVLNRRQDTMSLNKYNAKDGLLIETLFKETNERYVEPLHTLLFLHKNQDQFIYQSRRDGYNHAYLYNTDGKLIKQLTSGNWEITSIQNLDDQDNLFYTSTEESPIQRQVYRLNVVSGQKTRLTITPGIHTIILQKKSAYWIDSYTSITVPRIYKLMNSSGKEIRTLLTSKNPLANYNMPIVKMGTLKAADGVTDLYYRMILPLNFDSTKKYPVIVYVYGGPHEQLIKNQWLAGARLWDYMMSQKGYILFTIDNRGSDYRGFAFESVIHGQCGVEEMKDQLKGIEFLHTLGYADMNRVGVHGWSYGGFMTVSLVYDLPGHFQGWSRRRTCY